MKNSIQNIIAIAVIGLMFFLITQIQLLIIYFFIAIVLSITINPLNNFLCKMKLFKRQLNKTIAAIICLLIISTNGLLIGYILSPIVIEEVQILSSIQLTEVQNFLNILSLEINKKFTSINMDLELNLKDIMNMLDVTSIGGVFQSMIGILGNIFMAVFSILFISFFLIKDKALLKDYAIKSLGYFMPKSKQKINMIIYFIRRYCAGLFIQTSILFILFGIGMMILKLPNPWTLALFAAVVNIIPYFGPLIGLIFTVTMVGTFYIDQNMIDLILPLIIKSFILFGSVQTFDNFIIQPTIFSRAFKAHPLEIFFIAMGAGFIGGIMWMIIAMPVYTILRITFSELIANFE